MNVQVKVRQDAEPVVPQRIAIADCDVHPSPKSLEKDIYPFLEKRWQRHIET